MTLEILLKQKKVEIGKEKVPLEKVKVGAQKGSNYFFAGDREIFQDRKGSIDKEIRAKTMEIQKLKYEIEQIKKKIQREEKKRDKLQSMRDKWDELLDREVVDVYRSDSEDGVICVLIDGNEVGRFWTVAECEEENNE